MTEVRTVSVVDEAIARLKEHIERGEFAAGGRLPAEPVLAERLGVSRLSLREAVRALVVVGVLEARHGSGTYVTDLRPDKIVRILGGFLELTQDAHLGELLECRRTLEPSATALAATRITDAELAGLRARIERMAELDDPEKVIAEDLAFHAEIVAATGNPTLASLVDSVAQRTVGARLWRDMVNSGLRTVTHQQHQCIYDALASRDSLAAYAAATQHVASVESWLRTHLPVAPAS